MVTRRDYNAETVAAARSVMIELIHLLGEYRDVMVIIGGWVPEFLLPDTQEPHIGSIDIDLALDHRKITEECYRTITELLLSRGYTQGPQPFIFYRIVGAITVEVDLLAGEYDGTGKNRRHQYIPGGRVRKARGCDLVFDCNEEKTIAGELPGGGKDTVVVRVAAIVPFIVMKGMALDDRLKEKDAWDIYYCLRNYHGGVDALAEQFQPHLEHGLVQEGLTKIADKFASVDAIGPKHVADFDEMVGEERELCIRDAYERVNTLLDRLRRG